MRVIFDLKHLVIDRPHLVKGNHVGKEQRSQGRRRKGKSFFLCFFDSFFNFKVVFTAAIEVILPGEGF